MTSIQENPEPKTLSYTARDYQIELFQSAMEENIIVYLPTGSGKTFIAALLIKEKSYEVTKPLASGGKRTVFLVPTIVLAIQQAAYLRRHTPLKVKEFYGSMGVDFWGKQKWGAEFEENHVLVMTAQIFVDILNHAFFSVHQLNLLVFDECHAAVKDAPMKQVFSKLNTFGVNQRPKILGLTAALFRKRCKPGKIREVIQTLSETMGCVIKTPSDVEEVYCSSTKPCEIIIQYDNDDSAFTGDASYLSTTIRHMTDLLFKSLLPVYGDEHTKDEFNGTKKHVDKVEVLFDALKDILYTLKSFGPYGAFHCALVYLSILQGAKNQAQVAQFKMDLDKVSAHCQKIRELCSQRFEKHSMKNRLLLFVQPRVVRLLEILRKFNSKSMGSGNQENAVKMCGVIFVERRCMANVLYHFLKDIRQHDESLDFLKPLFVMGQASGKPSAIKENVILNMKHKEIMGQFREGICNLLVATSVLEEGIDVPACNLIVRFDRIKTYCDYVQTKGRARSIKAFYFILVSEEESNDCMEDMSQFHSIEQQLLMTENFEDDNEDDLNNLFFQFIPPYSPCGNEGPRITLQSSISLITRYCGQLSSDKDTVLSPQWTIDELKEKAVEPSVVLRIKKVIASAPNPIPSSYKYSANKPSSANANSVISYFQCRLLLPLNSPLREETIGDVMPTKRLAKRAVALKACMLLHQMREFDDVHLLPVPRSTVIEDEEEAVVEAQSVPTKANVFYKRYPTCLSKCQPLPDQNVFVYTLDFTLLELGTDESKHFYPHAVETKLGILSSKMIPSICHFPLVTRGGTFQVALTGVDSVIFQESQLRKLEKFHRFLFESVIFLGKRQLEFDLELTKTDYFIVPIRNDTNLIDFALVDKITNFPEIDWGNPPSRELAFHFDFSEYVDTVVVPWYNPLGALTPYYVDQITDLTPLSTFPKDDFKNYAKYYYHQYKLTLTNSEQRLLEVSREITGKNFLLPRQMLSKETPIHLVPELCHVHPIPGSLWKQVVWIPSILHRLNRMLAAEELRINICNETGVGVGFLPGGIDPSSIWSPMRCDQKKSYRMESTRSIPNTKPLLSTLKSSVVVDKTHVDYNDMWLLEYNETSNSASMSSSSTEKTIKGGISSDFERGTELSNPTPEKSSWSSENYPACFDSSNLTSISKFGPSPGLILEALTVAKTHEGFDMERLETMGDSILKLIISIYVYGQTTDDRCDEGRLTLMRTSQVKNKHLYHLGLQKDIGEFIVAQGFDIMANYLPPGFIPPVSNTESETKPHIQQSVSIKHIADCMEAIIGAYLLTTGIKGAFSIMEWMGLKTIPKGVMAFNEINGFPILSASFRSNSNPEACQQIECLYAGLDSFEQLLGYKFKNKTLLIEALTHASYLPNRITSCYQRLEFLGDAVLDYLVTRFYYDHPGQYSPAVLTDLRSAVVNNQTFAVLAVKNNFHLYMKHLSTTLNVLIDCFVRTQEGNSHMLMHDYFVLEETRKPNEWLASNVDVPKVLGDIFESVAGAIFIDSGMSLDVVWKSYLPFLRDSLDNFSKATPISALRALYECYPNHVGIGKPETLDDGRLSVTITIDTPESRAFKGAGGNSKGAKTAAAKYALSELKPQRD